MKRHISILSTATLGLDLEQEVADMDIDLHAMSFIDVVYVDDATLSTRVNDLATQDIAVAFTSQHAVMSCAKMLENKVVKWSIYSLGNKTKEVINQYIAREFSGSENDVVKERGVDAAALATIIINSNVKNIVFFCGDKRMDTLPHILNNVGVIVEEHIVYRTLETPHVVNVKYDGVLFFSPSGVSSFFNANKVDSGVVMFAIGNTTAEAIRQYTDNEIVISSQPVKRQVVLDSIAYFSSNSYLK